MLNLIARVKKKIPREMNKIQSQLFITSVMYTPGLLTPFCWIVRKITGFYIPYRGPILFYNFHLSKPCNFDVR